MNYKNFNDYELLDYIYSCNEDANEILLYKYRPLIVNIAKKMLKFCEGGVDLNDLVQEGMLGLNDAINNFRDDKETNFGTYARLCIERKIITLVRSTRAYKNKLLNESLPIENEEDNTIDKFLADNTHNPDYMVSSDDFEKNIFTRLEKQLTDLEKQVLELRKNDFNYKEIADILNKDPKAIDNALQRIKTKLKNIMNES